jgi:hypothetical protein
VYAGDAGGLAWLKACGVETSTFAGAPPTADQVLVVGPGGARELAPQAAAIGDWLKAGGHVLALGLDQEEANSFLPAKVAMQNQEHIAAEFPPFPADSLLAGVAPADVHNRDPRQLPLVTEGATVCGEGVLAQQGNVVFFQLPPFEVSKNMGALPGPFNLRRTFGRTSFAAGRLLGNFGGSGATPLLERFSDPIGASQEPSVIRNGDFSAATGSNGVADQWECNSKSAIPSREKLPEPDGGWAEVLTVPPAADRTKAPEIMIAQYDIPIRAGQWYRMSIRTRAEGLSTKEIHWTVQNTANWQGLIDYLDLAAKSDWQTNSFVVQAKGTATKGTKFQIWFAGTGKLWLADARLVPISDPTVGRWLEGLYLTKPTEWDDPYRFFGW